jgi:hypothetical protein
VAEFRAVPFHIRSGSDRYFFADDREAGGQLMGELAAYAESGTGPTQVIGLPSLPPAAPAGHAGDLVAHRLRCRPTGGAQCVPLASSTWPSSRVARVSWPAR